MLVEVRFEIYLLQQAAEKQATQLRQLAVKPNPPHDTSDGRFSQRQILKGSQPHHLGNGLVGRFAKIKLAVEGSLAT